MGMGVGVSGDKLLGATTSCLSTLHAPTTARRVCGDWMPSDATTKCRGGPLR